MKKAVLPVLLVFAMACGDAEQKEAPPEVDSTLIKEMDSAVKIAPDTTARKDTAATKKPVKKKISKQKVTKMKQIKQTAALKK